MREYFWTSRDKLEGSAELGFVDARLLLHLPHRSDDAGGRGGMRGLPIRLPKTDTIMNFGNNIVIFWLRQFSRLKFKESSLHRPAQDLENNIIISW